MAYGSEEFNALGGLKRSQITGDDEYLRQLNAITGQTVDSINRSGDAMARANQNKWDAINQGISNGFNTYRDVTKENRANARQEKQDEVASEERSHQREREMTADAQQAQKFGLDTEEQANRNKLVGLQTEEAQAQNAYNNKQVATNPDGTPITRREQMGNLDVKTKEGALAANQSALATSELQRQTVAYDMAKAKAGDERAHASALLYGPMSSGDQNAIAQVKQGLLNKGMSEADVNQTLQETQAKIAASADAKQGKLWISPEFEPVKDTLKDYDKKAQGLRLLADEKSKYDASKGDVYGEGKEGADALARVAQIRREYFGDEKSAQGLEGRWFKGTAGDDMQHYIDMQRNVLNNNYQVKKPELAKYAGREPYVANMMKSIEDGLKYKPTLMDNPNPTRPIFSVMPAATGPAANQQFMQQAAMNGNGQGFFQPPPANAPVAQPAGAPGQATQPQMPPQEHPLFKFRKK